MARRKRSKVARGGASAPPSGPARVQHDWARQIAAQSDLFVTPLLRRGARTPGLGASTFSRAVRGRLSMSRALVRPHLASTGPADRAGSPLSLLAQQTEMGLSHHHLYTLLAWLASRYDVGGERPLAARPRRGTLARSRANNPSLADLQALLSRSAPPASALPSARLAGAPPATRSVGAALAALTGGHALVSAASGHAHASSVTSGSLPISPALRFAQGLTALAGLVPATAHMTEGRPDDGDDAVPPYGSIIAGPWLATRTRRAARGVPALRDPTQMVRSPRVAELLSAASEAAPDAPPSGARPQPSPVRRTLTWSAATLWNDQPGHGHAGSGSPDVPTWRPTVPAIGALPLSAGSDSPRIGPGNAGRATAVLPRGVAAPAAPPSPFGLPPGLQRVAIMSAAPADWPRSGPAWSEGVEGRGQAATAPGALALALSRNVFAAADAVQSRAPIGLAVPDQPRTLQPSGAARGAALSGTRPTRSTFARPAFIGHHPARSAFIGDHPARHALAVPNRAAFVAEAGLSVAWAAGSGPAARAARVAAAEALRPGSLATVAARARPSLIAPGLRPVAPSLLAPAVPSALTPVARLSGAPSQLAALWGLAVARALPAPAPRAALLAPGRTLPAAQRIARGAAPLDATPALGAAPADVTLALTPAARADLADDPRAGSADAWSPTASVYDARAATVHASASPRTRRDRRASRAAEVTPAAGVAPVAPMAPVAGVRPSLPGRIAAVTVTAGLPLAPSEQQVGQRVTLGRQVEQRAELERQVGQRMAPGTPFAALSRTLALVARIQRAPGALSLPASATMADLPPAPLAGVLRRGYGLVPAGARPVARAGLPSRGHGGGGGWPASSVDTAILTSGAPTFMPGIAALIRAMPTFTPGAPALISGIPAFTPDGPTLAPGRDALLSPGAAPPPALVGLPHHALAHTVSLAGLMLAPPSTMAGFVPPGSLRDAIDGSRRPAGVASGQRWPADSYPPVARDALTRYMGVSALNVQRSATSPPASAAGVARLAGEPGLALGRPLWRHGLGGQRHSISGQQHDTGGPLFVDPEVTGQRPAARAAPWLATLLEPLDPAGQARPGTPVLASAMHLALAPAARLALTLASRLDARASDLAAPHATALPLLSRLMPSWTGRADTAPVPASAGRASGARPLLRGALSTGRVSPATAALAVPSGQPSLLSIVPTTRPALLSVLPTAHPALLPFLPGARPSLSPILRAAPVIQRLNAGTVPISTPPTLTLAASAIGTPAAGIYATSGPATEGSFTASGAMPATLIRHPRRDESIANAASSRSLATPAYPLVAPEDQPARSGMATDTVARGMQSFGRRAEVRAPSAALARALSLVSWARRVAVAGATEATPAGRDLVSPGLISPIAPLAAPGRRLTTAHTMPRNAGIARAAAEQSRLAGAGQAGSVGYGADALTDLAGDDHAAGRAEWPRAAAFHAPPLRPVLASLARFMPPAWLAAASRLPSGDLGASSSDLGASSSDLGASSSDLGASSSDLGPLPPGTRAPSGDVGTPFSGVRALPLPLVRAARALPLTPRTLVAAPATLPIQPALLAPLLQRRALPGAGEPGPLQRSIAVARAAHSVGRPLDAPARALMETALGRDLAPIQLHTDAPAGQAAAAVGARAFTLGRDVFFAPGAYQPQSPAGLALLGHELVHTGQQQAMVQRYSATGMAALSAAGEPPSLEAQATRTESSLLSLFSARPVPVARRAAESGVGGLAAWTASLPGHTTASPALSMDETPRTLYHEPVAAIQRAVAPSVQRAGNLFGAVGPTAASATSPARTLLLGAARGRANGASSSSAGAALPASASATAPVAQTEAAQAALPGVEDLVAQVLRRVKQELRLDHERAGGFLSDLMR